MEVKVKVSDLPTIWLQIAGANLQQPRGIAVDWVSQVVFWTDAMSGTIEMATFDGKFHKTLIDQNLVAVDDIEVDPESG